MIIPNKYEDLNQNPLIIGSYIIAHLKDKPYNIEKLFQRLREKHSLNLEQYYNALTFLWWADIITFSNSQLNINTKNAAE